MKTQLTQNLGYCLAAKGHPTLLIDLDPQASLTVFMGLQPWALEQSISDALLDKLGKTALPIHKGFYGQPLDLAPANIYLARAENQLVSDVGREFRLKRVVQPLLKQYEFVLIDCPPNLATLSILALMASTHVLIPVHTEYKCYMGTGQLFQTIEEVQLPELNPDLQIAAIVPTRYMAQTGHHQQVLAALKQDPSIQEKKIPIFEPVPQTVAFADAAQNNQPLALYDPGGSNAVRKAHHALDSIVKMLENL